MSTQVVITLPDEVYNRAERLAQFTERKVQELLAETVELSLSPLGASAERNAPISTLNDDEVLALTELQMDPRQDQRLSFLLDRQQAALLSEEEQAELWALMQIYQERLLRKAQALHEAVRRRLRGPLDP